jgi:tRNA(Ile)-lysidine synthase
MVLLHVLNTYRRILHLSLIVAHVNHGLRPAEAEKEAELVQKESVRLGVLFEYGQFDVKVFKKKRGLSLQDAARKLRFRFFHDLLRKHGAKKIALGQNADDQVETMLLRLLRGAGLEGLKGMLPMREGKVIRPLLETWREEIESFAHENGISYLVDSTNLKDDYLRNKLRLKLIPLLEREFQPNIKEVMRRTSEILREENDCLAQEATAAYRKIVREEGDILSLRWSEFKSLHKAIQWRVVQRMLQYVERKESTWEEPERGNVGRIYEKLSHPCSSFVMELSGGAILEKRYDHVSFKKGEMLAVPPFEVDLLTPGRTYVEELKRDVMVGEIPWSGNLADLQRSSSIAFLDYECLGFPLKLRNVRPGDRFQPLGAHGTQKLKEFFIDHKVPRFERPRIPLLISGDLIAWVVGYRIDERVKVTPKTRKVLRVEVR